MRVPCNTSGSIAPRFVQHRFWQLCANMKWIVDVSLGYFRKWLAKNGVFAAALIVPLLLGYGAALEAHMKRSSNPFVFNDDVRPHVVVEDKWITRAFHVRFECSAVAKEQRNNQCSSEDAVFRKPLAEIAE